MIINHRNQSKPCEVKVRPPYHISRAVIIIVDNSATLTCFQFELVIGRMFRFARHKSWPDEVK
jgi:hypothetical protein